MSLANSKATTLYKEALAATASGWDDAGVGFSEKTPVPGTTLLSRQLNSILYSVIKVNSEVEAVKGEVQQIHTRVKNLEGKLGQSSAGSPNFKAELENITNKLSKLKISEKEVGGNLKVFRNPYEVLKSLQNQK